MIILIGLAILFSAFGEVTIHSQIEVMPVLRLKVYGRQINENKSRIIINYRYTTDNIIIIEKSSIHLYLIFYH
jgi:hypothetical protein